MKNYFDLTGQTAVVTGASTGLGVQMAKAFASQGANLVLIARRQNLLEENAAAIEAEFGVEVLPYTCDITDTEKVKAAVAATMERFGRVDILVNNAGTGAVAPAVDITDEQFNNELKIDLFGSFICAREYAKEMIKAHYGRIINIASMYGLVGNMANMCTLSCRKRRRCQYDKSSCGRMGQGRNHSELYLPGIFHDSAYKRNS